MTLLGVRSYIWQEVAVMEACTAAVLVGVMRLLSCPYDGAWCSSWSVSCAFWRPFVLIVGVPCLLCSLAVPGVWCFLRVTPGKDASDAWLGTNSLGHTRED